MSQHRKHRGYESQRIVADYLRENGWPFAESTGAGRSGTDVTGVPGMDIEVAARRGFPFMSKINQQRARTEADSLSFVVLRPDGMGAKSVGDWPVFIPLRFLVNLLRDAGYGDPR
jgi:hypothetical protein